MCAAPLAASAAPAAPAAAAYKAPRTPFGQPDLQGFWSNATLTPDDRARRSSATAAAYTPDEVKKLEAAGVQEVADGNKPTDPNAPAEAPKVDPANAAARVRRGRRRRRRLQPRLDRSGRAR